MIFLLALLFAAMLLAVHIIGAQPWRRRFRMDNKLRERVKYWQEVRAGSIEPEDDEDREIKEMDIRSFARAVYNLYITYTTGDPTAVQWVAHNRYWDILEAYRSAPSDSFLTEETTKESTENLPSPTREFEVTYIEDQEVTPPTTVGEGKYRVLPGK